MILIITMKIGKKSKINISSTKKSANVKILILLVIKITIRLLIAERTIIRTTDVVVKMIIIRIRK